MYKTFRHIDKVVKYLLRFLIYLLPCMYFKISQIINLEIWLFPTLTVHWLIFFFFKILFFPFSPQSPLVHSCVFFVVGSSSCGMWDAASAWSDEQCHVRAQDLNQRDTGPPAAECANLPTPPRGQPLGHGSF